MKRLIAVLVGAVAWVPALEAQLPPVNPAAYQMATSPLFCLDIGDGYPIQATCSKEQPDASQIWTLSNTVVGGDTTLSSGTACLTADFVTEPPTLSLTECSDPPSAVQLWKLVRISASRTYQITANVVAPIYCLASPGSEEGTQLITIDCSDGGTSYGWVTNHPPTGSE